MASVKNIALATAGAAFFSLGVAGVEQANAVVLNFDDLGSPNNIIVGDEYISQGIVFSVPDNIFNNQLTLGGTCLSCSPTNSLGVDEIITGDFAGTIAGEFTGNLITNDLRLTLLNPFVSANTVDAFDIDGNLLVTLTGEDATINDTMDAQVFDLSGFAVHRFVTNGDFYAIDDVTFTVAPLQTTVPEASSALGVLAFGALGAGLMVKRQLRKQKLTVLI